MSARRWLLEAIAAATQRVHLQVYMAADDDVGSAVEAALAEAGARGVTVRVVVDSLHGAHGSLGVRNPLLERLGNRPGVELRAIDPITSPPSLVDLKQRDHRKIAVIDYNRANPRPKIPLVSIYPKEGTLVADHPYAILGWTELAPVKAEPLYYPATESERSELARAIFAIVEDAAARAAFNSDRDGYAARFDYSG